MYEVDLIANIDKRGRMEQIREDINVTLKGVAVTAFTINKNYCKLSVGGEERCRKEIFTAISMQIYELVLKIKYDYIYAELLKLLKPSFSLRLLVKALTCFEKTEERESFMRCIIVNNKINLDGVCNFLVRKFQDRWKEVCLLTLNNSCYLQDEEIMYELIRYLIDFEKIDYHSCDLYCVGGKYRVVEYENEKEIAESYFDDYEKMLCRLIDFSPRLTVARGFEDKKEYETLFFVFGAKGC